MQTTIADTPHKAVLLLAARLDEPVPQDLEQLAATFLSQEQRAHVQRCRREQDRRLRLLARILLGLALVELEGQELGSALRSIAQEERGRPFIQNSAWECSVSHSRNLVLCLLADKAAYGKVGIDAEWMSELDPRELAPAFCPEEQRALAAAREPKKLLFRLWTQKEACLKALGTGFLHDPARCNLLSVRPIGALPNLWRCNLLLPDCPNHAAAMAVEKGRPAAIMFSKPFVSQRKNGQLRPQTLSIMEFCPPAKAGYQPVFQQTDIRSHASKGYFPVRSVSDTFTQWWKG